MTLTRTCAHLWGGFILLAVTVAGAQEPPREVAEGWGDVDRILARIQAPTFPDRDFPITDYGAEEGGQAKCTDAIRAAIAAANAAGGGRVIVPRGIFLTGPVHLLSNVNLHVSEGGTLRFSTDFEDYLPAVLTRWEGVECMSYSPLVYSLDQENIAITGTGTLDGGSDWTNWWAWQDSSAGQGTWQTAARRRLFQMGEEGVPVEQRIFGEGSFLRPNFVQFYRSRNILIEGVNIRNSPMWHLHPVLSSNLTIRGVSIVSHGPNNDGLNPESCTDVLIEDCFFDTGDDCIAIKSGRNNDGRRVNVPSANIIVRNSTMKDGHGGVVIGSEISGGCYNVFVEHCRMDSPNLDRALRFKSNAQRGGIIEGIFMRDVTVGRVSEAVLTIDLLYEEGARGAHPPTVRRVHLDRITSENSPRIMFIAGFEAATIDDVVISNSIFRGLSASDRIQGAGRVVLDNVRAEAATAPRSQNSIR